MVTNDFLPFGINASNISTQVNYAADPLRLNGFTAKSEAPSALCNKVWRQSSMITSALAQAIMEITRKDMLDQNQNYGTLVENIKSIIGTQNWIKCSPIDFAIEDNYEYMVTGFNISPNNGGFIPFTLGTGPYSSTPIYRKDISFQYKTVDTLIHINEYLGWEEGDSINIVSYVFQYNSIFYYYNSYMGTINYTIDLMLPSSKPFEPTNYLYKRKLLA